jgi:hypothetical protein
MWRKRERLVFVTPWSACEQTKHGMHIWVLYQHTSDWSEGTALCLRCHKKTAAKTDDLVAVMTAVYVWWREQGVET